MTETVAEMTGYLDELLAVPSVFPPGDTAEICRVLAARLASWGYEPIITGPSARQCNVVASIGSGSPRIGLCTHIDTIGPGTRAHWSVDPFKATVKDGRVYGLGAENCKGAAAIFLAIARAVAQAGGPARGQVLFAFVGDEESLGNGGAKYLRDADLLRPDILVLGGPTGLEIGCEERGVVWLRVETRGQAFHAGSPQRGDNALLRAVRLINILEERLQPNLAMRRDAHFTSTLSITRAGGGYDINTIPDRAWFELDRRPLPGESIDSVVAEIKAVLSSADEPPGSWSLATLIASPGFEPGRAGPAVRAHQQAVAELTGREARFLVSEGASDGRHFAADGIEILNFGAGLGDRCHSPDEYIDLEQLEQGFAAQIRALAILTDGWKNGSTA
jgi:acetylornithine deacetylase/succinyl-diaminopimelate desuccinylase-like protein